MTHCVELRLLWRIDLLYEFPVDVSIPKVDRMPDWRLLKMECVLFSF